jgi:hypothetical protein
LAEFRASTAALEVRRLQRQVRHLRGRLREMEIERDFWEGLYEEAAASAWHPCPYCGRLTQQTACVLHADLEEIEGRWMRSVRRRKEQAA